MTVTYLDASAAMKLLVEEPESEALTTFLTADDDVRLLASWLLHTELHCAAGRHPGSVGMASVRTVLDVVTLVDLTRGDLLSAGTHRPLRSNDAIHLACALRVGSARLLTYDAQLAEAADRAGLIVLSPA